MPRLPSRSGSPWKGNTDERRSASVRRTSAVRRDGSAGSCAFHPEAIHPRAPVPDHGPPHTSSLDWASFASLLVPGLGAALKVCHGRGAGSSGRRSSSRWPRGLALAWTRGMAFGKLNAEFAHLYRKRYRKETGVLAGVPLDRARPLGGGIRRHDGLVAPMKASFFMFFDYVAMIGVPVLLVAARAQRGVRSTTGPCRRSSSSSSGRAASCTALSASGKSLSTEGRSVRQLVGKETRTIALKVKRWRPETADFTESTFEVQADRFSTVLDML